jgi:hypothetical protein
LRHTQYRRSTKSAAFLKRPFACNKVCGFRIFAAASQQFGVVCHHPSKSMCGSSVRADILVKYLLN